MGIEIERKFLVNLECLPRIDGVFYRQGYLNSDKERTVRIRTIGDAGFITVKGITKGLSRQEYEYSIPRKDADKMLTDLCEKPLIEKVRMNVRVGDHLFEIDQFFGDNKGLIIAEVELNSEKEDFERPEWLGDEVTGDPKYYNSNLIKSPYKTW